MRPFVTSFVAALALVTQITQALPQPETYPTTNVHHLSTRAEPKPHQKTVAGHLGLYIPMLYAGYLSSKTGKFERYNCDSTTGKETKVIGTFPEPRQRQMVTDGLTSCVSFTVVGKEGALKAHVPPYVCDVLSGKKTDKGYVNHVKNLKAAFKALLRDHKVDLKGGKTIAIGGQDSDKAKILSLLKELLGAEGADVYQKLEVPLDVTNDHRTTVIDMSVVPFKFFVEGREVRI